MQTYFAVERSYWVLDNLRKQSIQRLLRMFLAGIRHKEQHQIEACSSPLRTPCSLARLRLYIQDCTCSLWVLNFRGGNLQSSDSTRTQSTLARSDISLLHIGRRERSLALA